MKLGIVMALRRLISSTLPIQIIHHFEEMNWFKCNVEVL